ncbi:wall-associated receptor kinase-like 1 [Macadamia integrifolia]|uniref:wall-associated receptor kinase-like 1 n=1 Tax=Macadamia integrifolia TaxID=60698 RepID=UPI001C4E7C6A|nr:wall-associated receptor kinase-like 1 [Macadamia integrifolia]XP_042481095.1 wall-associated receptor kinase-like 1 [Macadamia integrifolia]
MEFPSPSSFLHLYLLVVSFLSLFLLSGSQQSYLGSYQLDCYNNNSVTSGYLCNGPQRSCSSYLTFRSTYPYDSPLSISYLLASNASQIAQINNISEIDRIPTGNLIIVPVNCSCFGKFYQHNTSYTLKAGDTYFRVSNNTYQGLTTCKALMNQNPYESQNLSVGSQLLVPLRCACTTMNQTASGVRFLLTYLVTWGDSVSSIGEMFGVDEQSITRANNFSSDTALYSFTPILIPLKTEPTMRQNGLPSTPPPPVSPTPSFFPAAETPMAKDGCKENCGNISIPYPFGIGNECYFDKSFEILCNDTNSNPSVPFLQYPDVEVLEFLPDYAVRVVYTSVASTCSQSGSTELSEAIDFPFTFSVTHNNFNAIGCDISAGFTRLNGGNNSNGCMSVCVNNTMPTMNSIISSCSGDGCCKTTVPSNVQLYDVKVFNLDVSGASNSCGVAFLADANFSDYNQFDLSSISNALNSTNYRIPVVFDWVIANSTCEEARKVSSVQGYACGKNTYCIDSNNGPGYRCSCSEGFQGNPYLPDGCKGSKAGTPLVVMVILGTGIAMALIILTAVSLWLYSLYVKRQKIKLKQKFFKKNGGLLLQQQVSSHDHSVEKIKICCIEELEKATDNFNGSRILGNGGSGTVYKGMLSDGRMVAIKKSNIVDESQIGQFINEVVILAQINHRNIVKLLGCCLETQVPLLVYEFVLNGTLSYHLHGEGQVSSLSWENRLRIATEIAGAVAYLHSSATNPIFHRDIKSSNILLDENYRTKVADFGISRTVPIDRTHLTTLVQGTFGYLDPEYFHSSQFTEKSDVYSFGVVLAELLTGQKAVFFNDFHEEKGLAMHFISALKENFLFEVLETRVVNEGNIDQLLAISRLAKKCLKVNGKKRPAMKEVAAALEGLRSFQVRHPLVSSTTKEHRHA